MKSEVLRELLAEVGPATVDAGRLTFSERDEVTLLVAAHGTSLAVEGVCSASVRSGYVVAEAADGETYFLCLDQLVGLKVRRGKREGPGFR